MSAYIISKKLPTSRIVWFGISNQWVHLEEPAWYVYTLLKKSQSHEAVARKCSSRYNLTFEESLRFVKEMAGVFTGFEEPFQIDPEINFSPEVLNKLDFTTFSTRYYHIKDKSIAFSFGSRTAEYFIHPPFAHLETEKSTTVNVHFEIFTHEGRPILRRRDLPDFSSTADDFNRLKKKLYIDLINVIYNKTNDHWMTFLHASGISDGNNTILLSSASGSGKSTMAALLQAKGFQLVSDDFIPLAARGKHAYPFPAAISVKEDGFSVLTPFYGNLQDKSYNLYPYTHSSVRYLKPLREVKENFTPLPVKSLIFIRYNPDIRCDLTPLQIPEALKLFHDQAWVSHNPDHAKAFIDWFVKLECYKLEYSDNEKGILAIMGKF